MKTNMIIVAAPSGAGKSTFVERALRDFPILQDTTTYTTREMRTGESEGNPYYFVSKKEFKNLIKQDFFVEWAQVHTNLYGTSHKNIQDIISSNHVVIMDVDVQGVKTFKNKFPDCIRIFILPPSIDELKRRILLRDKIIPKDIDVRLSNALKEMKQADQFDFQVINDDLDNSYGKFKKIIADLLESD